MHPKDKNHIKNYGNARLAYNTTELANDIHILRFISYRDSDWELMQYLKATTSISFCIAVANVLTSRLSLFNLITHGKHPAKIQ